MTVKSKEPVPGWESEDKIIILDQIKCALSKTHLWLHCMADNDFVIQKQTTVIHSYD
jgi:hypothetical protein